MDKDGGSARYEPILPCNGLSFRSIHALRKALQNPSIEIVAEQLQTRGHLGLADGPSDTDLANAARTGSGLVRYAKIPCCQNIQKRSELKAYDFLDATRSSESSG